MDLVLRACYLFALIYVLMRVIGRRELSSLEPFDLVLLIVVGDAVQQGLTQDDYSITGATIVIVTIALLQVGLSYLGFKVPFMRTPLEGEPIVVVQDGKILEKNLSRERVTAEELAVEARKQQIDSLEQVKWAVLETSGEITFIEK